MARLAEMAGGIVLAVIFAAGVVYLLLPKSNRKRRK